MISIIFIAFLVNLPGWIILSICHYQYMKKASGKFREKWGVLWVAGIFLLSIPLALASIWIYGYVFQLEETTGWLFVSYRVGFLPASIILGLLLYFIGKLWY